MTTLALLRETMTEFLQNQGIRALSAWPRAERTGRTEPLAGVRGEGREARAARPAGQAGRATDPQTTGGGLAFR